MNKLACFLFVLIILFFNPIVWSQEYPFQKGHTRDILHVKFSPEGKQLISYSAGDKQLCLWNVNCGELLWMSPTECVQKLNEDYNLKGFYWSKDSRFILTVSENTTWQTWSVKTGEILAVSANHPNIPTMPEITSKLSVTQDDSYFFVFNRETKKTVAVKKHDSGKRPYDISDDGSLFAEAGSYRNETITITEIKTGKIHFLDGHPGVVHSIVYSSKGKYLAVSGSDRNIYVFDTREYNLSKIIGGNSDYANSIDFSLDGKILISVNSKGIIKVWNWMEGKLVHEIKSRICWSWEQIVKFSTNGKYFLIVGKDDVSFEIWDAIKWQHLHDIKTSEGFKSSSGGMTLEHDSVPILTAMFMESGDKVLSSYRDGTLRTWGTRSGKQINTFKINGIVPMLGITLDEKTILAAVEKNGDFQIRLLDIKWGWTIKTYFLEQNCCLEALSLSLRGHHFATSDIHGDVLLWRLDKKTPIRELENGPSQDDTIVFDPKGKTSAVGGENQNVAVFDVKTGKKIWQLLPFYQPGDFEQHLLKERERKYHKFRILQEQRDKRIAEEIEVYKKLVYISFQHFGDDVDVLKLRMMESSQPEQSKVKIPPESAQGLWFCLHNDSPLPVSIRTFSQYFSRNPCFHTFPSGRKIFGLCDNGEIFIAYRVENKDGSIVPSPFDSFSSAILLPKTTVLFNVSRNDLKLNRVIRIYYTFINETKDSEIEAYGSQNILRFTSSSIPRAIPKN
jgi:WD40 repeat protein